MNEDASEHASTTSKATSKARRVQKGRYTAVADDPGHEVVVFLIGMRFNKLWKIHRWWPPFAAMPKMLAELRQHPDKGLLGARMAFGGRTITVVQYWRSFDHLEAYARSTDDLHLPAWRRFNARVGASGDVGVYHETYRLTPGSYETVYSNMPVMGLAAAIGHAPVRRAADGARDRITASA